MNDHNEPIEVPLRALPPIPLEKYIEESGLSRTTAYRYRKAGVLKCINIAGRWYISREAIAEFNRRADAGEFAGKTQHPRNNQQRDAQCD
jgi:hypothetical protein